MHQSINLLQADLLPKRDLASFKHVALLTAVSVSLLLGFSAWDWHQMTQDEAHLKRLKQELAVLTASNNDLKQRSSATPDPDLQRVVEQLGKRESDEQQLAQVLISLDLSEGFASYLDDLSRVHVPGLWLEQIQLEAGGREVALSGYAHSADKVPQFLKDLSRGEGFRGHVFDHLELKAQDNGALAFALRSPDPEPSS